MDDLFVENKAKLTELQYYVTQENGTESAFNNDYWDNHEHGIYLDVVSNTPLFLSIDKYDSGTGWPSFTKPIADNVITTVEDHSNGMTRVEVRSAISDSHLGHVFSDGPPPLNTRFCINSAALRFVPMDELSEEGLDDYLDIFERHDV